MISIQKLLVDNLDIWASADTGKKSGRGRSSSDAGSVYGIKKLRELILELAVRGKLVPQDANDEPASELLNCIQAEKAKLVVNGKLKMQTPLTPIVDNKKAFDLPRGWQWARFGDIYRFEYGDNLPSEKRSNSGEFPVYGSNGIVGTHNVCLVDEPCIVIGRKGSAGALNLCLTKGCCITDVAYYCIPPKNVDLLFSFKLFCTLRLDFLGKGIKPGLNRNDVYDLIIAIPPIGEQHRIVAKVDELMALCDQIEEKHINAVQAHEKLVNHLLDALTQPQNAEDFSECWQRISTHFDILFTTERSIDALKETILQLAVMGKLVPQDSNDEPASELLKRIQAEKAQLIKEGKIKKDKPLATIADDEKPFDLPKGWEWVKLNNLLSKIGAGSTPLGGKQIYKKQGIPLLRSQNVWNDGLRLDDVAFISEEIHEKMLGSRVCSGDLLFNITGASIGRCAIVPDSFKNGNVSQHVTIIRLVDSQILPFIHTLLISTYIQRKVMEVQVGVSREGLSIGKLGQFIIPIPPLSEQHRIVVKVDELITLCDRMKERLNEIHLLQKKVADVLVEQCLTIN